MIAVDKTVSRVKKLEDNVNRFGVSNVTCFSFDSTKSCSHQQHLKGEDIVTMFCCC